MDRQRIVRILFISVLVEVIGFGLVLPIIPLLFTDPASTFFILPDAYSLQTGYILLGLLIAAYPVGQFIATPILGQFSDRHGRRSMLILSILGTVIANLVFAAGIVWGNIPLLFLSRFVNGLTGGNISIVQAAIADITPGGERAANFGKIGAAFGLGFIIGPFLGGILSSTAIHPLFTAATPFLFAAVLSALSMLFVYLALPETAPMTGPGGIDWLQSVHNVRSAFDRPDRRHLFAVSLLYFSGFTFFTSFVPVFLNGRFGFDQFMIGNFFLFAGIFVLVGQLKVVPYVSHRFAESRVLPVAMVLTGTFILAQWAAPTLIVLALAVPPFAFSNAVSQVFVTTLISRTASQEEQGVVLGVNQSLRAVGQAIPSALAGATAALAAPSTPLLVAALIIIGTGIGYTLVRKSQG